MARNFAVLNPAALGPALELEQGGMVLSSNAGSLNISRLARGTIAPAAGKAFFEVAFYGEGALLNQSAVGIVRASHSLAKFPGEQASGYGLKVGNGGIYSNNAQIAATTAVAKQVYIGVLLDLGALTCSWFANGSLLAKVAIAAGLYYPAVTVSAGEAYALRAWVNCGQDWFEHPQRGTPDNSGVYVPGWYADSAAPEQLRFLPRVCGGYHTTETDALPLVPFDPRISNPETLQYSRKCSVWPWGGSSAGASFGAIEIDNSDGRYDFVCGEDRRDQIVQFLEVRRDQPYNAATVVATGVVERVEPIGETGIRITVKDKLTSLERVLLRRRYPPWADAGVAGLPVPVVLGAVRNINRALEDSVNRTIRLSDAAVTNVVAVRDKGALLDPHASPPQYTTAANGTALALETNAVGLLTVDCSSEGAQVLIPGAADILAGAGLLTTWPNPAVAPPGWTWTPSASATLVRYGVAQAYPQDYVAAMDSTAAYNPQVGEYGSHLRTGAVLQPGRTYRIQFRLVRTFGPPSTAGGAGKREAGIMLRTDLTSSPIGAVTDHMYPMQGPQFGVSGQAYTFTYTVPAGAARPLYVIACAARDGTGHGIGFAGVVWYGLKIELLGEAAQALPLQGITLEGYMREIFSRAGVDESEWVPADAAAIDAAAAGATIGADLDQQISVRDALRFPLDSYCAALFTDHFGRYRVRALRDPSTIADVDLVAELTDNEIEPGVTPRQDLAPGLTTQMGARRNWHRFSDADFVSDLLTVPPALRTQFKRDFQFIEPAAVTLSPSYAFAQQANPVGSLFDLSAPARAAITAVVAPYAQGRRRADGSQITTTPRFVEFAYCYSTDAPPQYLFSDGVRVTYPRHRLDTGQKLAVVDVSYTFWTQRVQLNMWGVE